MRSLRHTFVDRLAVAAAAFCLIAAGSIGTASPALAYGSTPDCDVNGHCYAISTSPQGSYYAVHMDEQQMNDSSGGSSVATGYHISSEVWAWGVNHNASVPGHNSYIESGIYNGWVYPNGYTTNPCLVKPGGYTLCVQVTYESGAVNESPACAASGCGAYVFFWADTNFTDSTHAYQHIHIVHFTSPNPSQRIGFDMGNVGTQNGHPNTFQVHIYNMGGAVFDYYGNSYYTGMIDYNFTQVGGELSQTSDAPACSDAANMNMWNYDFNNHNIQYH